MRFLTSFLTTLLALGSLSVATPIGATPALREVHLDRTARAADVTEKLSFTVREDKAVSETTEVDLTIPEPGQIIKREDLTTAEAATADEVPDPGNII